MEDEKECLLDETIKVIGPAKDFIVSFSTSKHHYREFSLS